MKFRLDPQLFEGVTSSREREWRQTLMELNLDFGAPFGSAEPEPTLTFARRDDGGVDVTVEVPEGPSEVVALSRARMRTHFRRYRDAIKQLVQATSGVFGAGDAVTLDRGKKGVHNAAADTVQASFADVLDLDHEQARRVFTLVFLVSAALPEALVTRHRHRKPGN